MLTASSPSSATNFDDRVEHLYLSGMVSR